jgi:hypothetical protein
MSKFFKNKVQRTRINQGEYFSRYTGEELIEANEGFLTIQKVTGIIEVDYKHYFHMNEEVLDFLETIFTPEEFAKIQKMCRMITVTSNILHSKRNEPHTFDTLSEELNVSRNRFYKFLEKLYKEGVVWKTTGYTSDFKIGNPTKKKFVLYILNPALAKKGSIHDTDIIAYFAKFKMTL